jgi:putative ABC transport system ATP-binding protein
MEVAQKMTRRLYAPGEAVVTQGEEGDRFYVISEGRVDVEVGGPEATRVVSTIGRGGFFGERALIVSEPRNATVRAREPLEVYSLDKEDFEAAIARSKTFKDQLLAAIFSRG